MAAIVDCTIEKSCIFKAKWQTIHVYCSTLTFTDQATFNDGTAIDWTAIQTAFITMSGQNDKFEVSSTDGYDKYESVEQGDTAKTAVITKQNVLEANPRRGLPYDKAEHC